MDFNKKLLFVMFSNIGIQLYSNFMMVKGKERVPAGLWFILYVFILHLDSNIASKPLFTDKGREGSFSQNKDMFLTQIIWLQNTLNFF